MTATLRVQHLRKAYGLVEAVRDVSFEVARGEIFGLLGPNGAGKTTTVECVLGLREPDAGTIEVCGLDARREPRAAKAKIGAALQSTALQEQITAREALHLFASFYRRSVDAAALLTRFGLADKADAAFATLSGGQRQRLALALAFINDPELVALDEPTAGLDPAARRDLHDSILQMKRDGHTVLLTTHDLEEAAELCDRVAVIHRGRLVTTGAPRDLAARLVTTPTIVVTTSAAIDPQWIAALPGVTDVAVTNATATFRAAQVSPTLAAITARLAVAGIEILDLHVQRATLEDVFLDATRAD